MNPRRLLSFPIIARTLALVCALAAPSAASDLTGTWAGRLRCTGLDAAGARVSTRVDSTLEVSQSGNAIAVLVDGALLYEGAVTDAANAPGAKGMAALEGCQNDGDPNAIAEMASADFRLSARTPRGRLSLDLVSREDGVRECKGTYSRQDAADPGVAACPVYYVCFCNGVSGGPGGCGNGGAGGNNADIHPDVSNATRLAIYENGNNTGWVCTPQ
ncbi:MAG: hypothetical protein KC560_11210 [Myxococcales bacterium]|nr:hypothetical protein [Myxococcales bacterium]